MKRLAPVLTIVSSLAIALSVQRGASTPATQQPVFRTTTDLIQVDTVVVDKDGKPVHGLTKDDFEIYDNGTRQSVVAVNEYHHERIASPVSLDVANNSAERLVVLVLDDGKSTGDRLDQKKNVTRSFIRELAGHAQMALVRTSTEPGVEFTSNAQALLDALDAPPTRVQPFVPPMWTGLNFNGPQPGMAPPESHMTPLMPEHSPGRVGQGAYTRPIPNTDFNAIRDGSLSANDGRRKTFIVISEGQFNNGELDFIASDARKQAEGKLSPKRLLNDLHKKFTQMLEVAERSNSAIYVVNPFEGGPAARSPEAAASAKLMSDALAALATRTGGQSVGRGDGLPSRVDRVMEDIDSYYVLGFSPSDRRGKAHSVEVRVHRPDLVVRHRQQYGRDDPARDRAVQASAKDPLLGLAYSPVSTGDIPLRAWATITTPSPGTAGAPLSLWLDAGDTRLDEYGVFVINMNTNKESVKPVGRSLVGAAPSPLPLDTPALAPGRYQLRIAARSADAGRGGSVYLTVEIPDFTKTPLAITGLVLGGGNTRRPNLGSLPFLPTLDRTFDATTTLRVAFDVWRQTPMDDARAVVEIVNGDGSIARQIQDATLAMSDHHVDTPVPLTGLTPGLYILRITATGGATRAQQEIGFQIVARR